jgi:hypothetical protein
MGLNLQKSLFLAAMRIIAMPEKKGFRRSKKNTGKR